MILDPRCLGQTITRLRQQAGLNQGQLAVRARIPRPTIAGAEKGRCLPSLGTTVAIADALCMTVDELIEQARAEPAGEIPHGTAGGYGNHGCRCGSCREEAR